MDAKYIRPIRSVVSTSFLIVAALSAYCWTALRPLPFDSNLWKRARAQKESEICYRMSASLVEKLSTEKLSYDQVVELLGAPDYRATSIIWRYKLKAHRGTIFRDDYWLWIFVSDDNRTIVKAAVHQG